MNFKLLTKPYPFTGNFKDSLKTISFISWFIFFFVFFFRSEQFLGDDDTTAKLLVSFYYGFTTFSVAIINTLIFGFFIKPENEQNWKVYNEIILYLIHFITISIAIHFLSFYVTQKEMVFSGLLYSVFTTTLIGLIPVSIHVINEQKKMFKKHYELASQMQPEILLKQIAPDQHKLSFNGDSFKASELLYVESNRNYVNMSLLDGKELTMRYTIKEMENKLSAYPQFLRCHRAYIVNTEKIINVTGNAQGLKLFMDEVSFVPVSRSYISKIDHVIRPNK